MAMAMAIDWCSILTLVWQVIKRSRDIGKGAKNAVQLGLAVVTLPSSGSPQNPR